MSAVPCFSLQTQARNFDYRYRTNLPGAIGCLDDTYQFVPFGRERERDSTVAIPTICAPWRLTCSSTNLFPAFVDGFWFWVEALYHSCTYVQHNGFFGNVLLNPASSNYRIEICAFGHTAITSENIAARFKSIKYMF